MENKCNLLNVLIETPLLKNDISLLIDQEQFDELIHLSNDVTLTVDAFVLTFIQEIHYQTNWILKQDSILESQWNSSKKTLASKHKVKRDEQTQHTTISPKKQGTSGEKRQRPRVKLFSSPLRGENSPTSPSFSTSTPKQLSNRSTNSSDSLASPLWPNLHSPSAHCRKDGSASSPGSARNHDDSRNRRLKISLGDFVSTDLNSPKGKNRRIKPTKLTPDTSKVLPTDGPFGIESPHSEGPSLIDDRLATKMNAVMTLNLSEDKKKIQVASTHEKGNKTPGVELPAARANVLPTYEKSSVTCAENIEMLAELYGLLLAKNACDNLMSELYFLISLLVSPEKPEKATEQAPFNSLNNCAYFAVTTLSKIQGIIILLTSTTLGLLAAQPAVQQFAPDFQKTLETISLKKFNKSSNWIHVPQDGNVSFQCDTDNAENFTTQQNFSSFRKQRDAFYNLLQLWEKSHNDNGFNFKNSLASKARSILTIQDDATNLLHLARLFRNQLLASCAIHSASLDEAGEEVLELLPYADRDRLSRLQARLSEPRHNRGPVPSPDFPGRQLFFKEFIIACGPGLFNRCLQLCLVDELLKLNDFDYSPDGCESFADDLTQKQYLECVSSARLLAKFLALSEYFPFYCNGTLTEQVLNLHCSTRLKILPLFDLESCLKGAAKNHRLVLTLPWIVTYLSLMDSVTIRLPGNVKVLQNLSWLRRNVPKSVAPLGRLMLQLSLGWLLQVVQIPALTEEVLDIPAGITDLDDIEVVSEVVLNHVCPFLNELNSLLTGNKAHPTRHIRPTPTKPSEDRVKQLELRLEESFIQNQSQSTRRSIQFVAERVASCCIKEIASDILPKMGKSTKKKLLQNLLSEKWSTDSSPFKEALQICQTRSAQSLRGLLWKDVDEIVIKNAIALATRQSLEKVRNWLQNNAVENLNDSTTVSQDCEDQSIELSEFLPDSINALRDVVVKNEQGILSDADLVKALDLTQMILTTRPLPPPTERGILCMLVEILTELANKSVQTHLWKDIAHVIRLTNPQNHASNPLKRLFCARTIKYATKQLMQLPIFLVEENLITAEDALKQSQHCATFNLPKASKDEILNTINVLQKK